VTRSPNVLLWVQLWNNFNPNHALFLNPKPSRVVSCGEAVTHLAAKHSSANVSVFKSIQVKYSFKRSQIIRSEITGRSSRNEDWLYTTAVVGVTPSCISLLYNLAASWTSGVGMGMFKEWSKALVRFVCLTVYILKAGRAWVWGGGGGLTAFCAVQFDLLTLWPLWPLPLSIPTSPLSGAEQNKQQTKPHSDHSFNLSLLHSHKATSASSVVHPPPTHTHTHTSPVTYHTKPTPSQSTADAQLWILPARQWHRLSGERDVTEALDPPPGVAQLFFATHAILGSWQSPRTGSAGNALQLRAILGISQTDVAATRPSGRRRDDALGGSDKKKFKKRFS